MFLPNETQNFIAPPIPKPWNSPVKTKKRNIGCKCSKSLYFQKPRGFHPVVYVNPLHQKTLTWLKIKVPLICYFPKGWGKEAFINHTSRREQPPLFSVWNTSTVFTPPIPAPAAISHLNLFKASSQAMAKAVLQLYTLFPWKTNPCSLTRVFICTHRAQLWHCGPVKKFQCQPYRKGRGDVL